MSGKRHFETLDGLRGIGALVGAYPLLMAVGAGDETGGITTSRIVRFLGAVSYPLYMTHYPFKLMLLWLYRATSPWPMLAVVLSIVLFIPLAMVFAWLTMKYYCPLFVRKGTTPRQGSGFSDAFLVELS